MKGRGEDGTGRLLYSMVFMLDGISDIGAQGMRHLSYWICLRHLIRLGGAAFRKNKSYFFDV